MSPTTSPTDAKAHVEDETTVDRVEQQQSERHNTPACATSRSFVADKDKTNNDDRKEATANEEGSIPPLKDEDHQKRRIHYPSIVVANEPTIAQGRMPIETSTHKKGSTSSQSGPDVVVVQEARSLVQPGAVAVEGPRLHSSTETYDPELPPDIITVAATPLDESIVVDAKPVENCLKKYKYLLIGLLLTVGIVTAATLAVKIPEKKRIEQRNQGITTILLDLSNKEQISEFDAAQLNAKNWMLGANNTNLDPKNDMDKIGQRYVLAVLYYSTNGGQWVEKGNFLSSGDECHWHPTVNCTMGEHVMYMQLGKSFLILDNAFTLIQYMHTTLCLRMFLCMLSQSNNDQKNDKKITI